ncbi:hypothetical protein [Candidatus Viridilinea mediisalina]|uniref:Uncharacterized protein n=1 Tax=Candidatus Viridilinea mediisalina TaxID=2024553 RepID=A0A2A6RLN8_9CHLR|nr:hypothetical protein [Candidatus Viridilinea mediisalina]PDW03789.1 hypothetical protein CJ255_06960 [Candidatus Viridilinea mediisalina]
MPAPSSRGQRRKPIRSLGSGTAAKPTPALAYTQPARPVEPRDYSRDYADVRRDLRMIALVSSLLLVGMVVISFVL